VSSVSMDADRQKFVNRSLGMLQRWRSILTIRVLKVLLSKPVDLLIQDLARPVPNGWQLYFVAVFGHNLS
jgi:hypothetical protein